MCGKDKDKSRKKIEGYKDWLNFFERKFHR